MIKDLLKKENIKMFDHALEWEDAIRYCVQPLVDCHCVEARYAEEIIANTLKMGPYYVIAKNLALIHGRSDQGVIAKQLAITLSKEAIVFSKEKKAKLLVVLAAEDSESHIGALSKLAEIFMDESRIEKICGFDSIEEIYEEFLKADKGK